MGVINAYFWQHRRVEIQHSISIVFEQVELSSTADAADLVDVRARNSDGRALEAERGHRSRL